MLKRLLVSGLFAGFAAGLIAAALLQLFVTPVLQEAELYETGELVHFGGSGGSALEHDHDSHEHIDGEGGDRALLSLGAAIATNIGYALVLVALMALAERSGQVISAGLLWGVAGFVAFQLMPAFGHPPELPGNAAADLQGRQMWWAMTAVASSIGIACIAFGKGWGLWIAGIAALALPHIIGAPHPDMLSGPTPPEIAGLFASRALGVALIVWVALGSLAGYFWSSEDNAWVGSDR